MGIFFADPGDGALAGPLTHAASFVGLPQVTRETAYISWWRR